MSKAGRFTISINSVFARLHHTEDIDELIDYGVCSVGSLNWLPDPTGQPHTVDVVIDDDEDGLIGDYLALIVQDQSSLEVMVYMTDSDDEVKANYRLESPLITKLTTSPRTRFTEEYEKDCRFTLTLNYSFAKKTN